MTDSLIFVWVPIGGMIGVALYSIYIAIENRNKRRRILLEQQTDEAESIHNQAMEIAENAFVLEKRSGIEAARSLYEQALLFEYLAASRLFTRTDCEPTRSILHRSAALLALKIGMIDEAERCVKTGIKQPDPCIKGDKNV